MSDEDGSVRSGGGGVFPRAFWSLIGVQTLERLAYYTLRVMAPIYLMQADDPGGLHLTAGHKGTIYACWAAIQSLGPILTGGFADRLGYKRTLGFSFALMTAGYMTIALGRDVSGFDGEAWAGTPWNFVFFLAGIIVLAAGVACFKPGLKAPLAHCMTRGTASVGWSIYYLVFNAGSLIGHYMPAVFLRGDHTPEAWRNLFLASAGIMCLNFLMLLTFRDVPSGADRGEGVFKILRRTAATLCEPRLAAWMVIMAGFYMMMFQMWDLQPNFIADWIDSRPAAEAMAFLPDWLYDSLTRETTRGRQVPQNVLLSLNTVLVLVGVVAGGWCLRGVRTFSAIVGGYVLVATGLVIAGLTMSAWFLAMGIGVFSVGEIAASPRKNQYLSLIAPRGRKGMYMGFSSIPTGLGGIIGSKTAGYLYGHYGEKATLALRYLAEHTEAGKGVEWNGDPTRLPAALGIPRARAMATLEAALGIDSSAATRLLWETYSPQYAVWVPFVSVGAACICAMWVFGRLARRWDRMDV